MKKDVLEKLLARTFSFLSVSPTLVVEESEDGVLVSINGNELSHLIGYRGDSLNALQHFLNSAYFNNSGEYVRILVDINGYREQRNGKIEEMVKNFIDRVRFFSREVEMPPMNPSERRVVHTFISNYDDVMSESTGAGRDRRVVLKPKKDN
jgi:spoIIIJ-associated protein